MTKELFPGKPKNKGTMIDALARMGDGDGLRPASGSTITDMSTPHFGGHRAAPFTKGGGRSKDHPNDAKGKKRAVAKAVLKAKAKGKPAKGGDYSNVDLAFNRSEPRDQKGRWVGMSVPHHGIRVGDSLDADGKVVVSKVTPYGKGTMVESRVTGARALRFTPTVTEYKGDSHTIYRHMPGVKTLEQKNEAARNLLTRGKVSKRESKLLAAKNDLARATLERDDALIKKYHGKVKKYGG